MAPKFRLKKYSVYEQRAYIRNLWPSLVCTIARGRLVCRGPLKPFPMAAVYTVRIEYLEPKKPITWIEDPPLQKTSHSARLEHIYKDDSACTFYPRTDWNAGRLLAYTVIPWLLEWLLFYEIWLVTGTWEGGGIHPLGA